MRLGGVVRPGDWTEAEIAHLREWAGKKTGREIAADLGRTKHATLRKMTVLGIKGFDHGSRRRLSDERRAALKAVQPGTMTRRQFAIAHGMSEDSVRWWAKKLAIPFKADYHWNAANLERLRELAPSHTANELAAIFSRSADGIREKLREIGVTPKPGYTIPRPWKRVESTPKTRPLRFWTAEDDARLRGLASKPIDEIAATLGRTVRSVAHRAERTGVKLFDGRTRNGRRAPLQMQRTAPVRREVRSALEWCRECHAPVSNWEQHFERQGHRRPAA